MSEYFGMSVQDLIETADGLLDKGAGNFNPEKAAEMLEAAVSFGSMTALEKLADCYFYGRGKEENDEKAFEAYQRSHNATASAYCAYQMGRMYRAGWGVNSDIAKAKEYLEESWSSGYSAAAGIMGDICLERAEKTQDGKDAEEGLKWLQRGSGKGDPYSTYRLAVVFATGDYGLFEDKKRAYDLLMKVKDYPPALGYLVDKNGFGICGNAQYSELVDMAIQLAGETENGALYRRIGSAYEGKTRLGEDPEKSLEYFLKALDAGDGFAGYLAGNNYRYGWSGYCEDAKKAEELLLKGANLGCEQAMSSMGDLLKDRAKESWPRNPDLMRAAFEWYEKAYKKGGSTWDALHAGEAALEAGDDLDQRAAECLKVAMDDNIHWAYMPLARLSIKEGGSAFCPELAIRALEKARSEEIVEFKIGEVDYLTGLMFEKGMGLPIAANQAVEFYLKASDKGFSEAKEALKRFKKGLFGWKQIS